MHTRKDDMPIKIKSKEAVVRQLPGFGDASGRGELSAEHMTFKKGTDITGLLEGLEGDLCQCPHWGYVLEGALTIRYADGAEEKPRAGEFIYLQPGHTVRADKDTSLVLFSPQNEHTAVLDHIQAKMGQTVEA